ncbi:MAG: hypothetical protein ACOC0N_02545 [Chroococcales cyanobacterium]
MVTHLLLLILGLGIFWLGLKIQEEVYRLSVAVMGTMCFVWGFSITPMSLQLLIEGFVILPIALISLRTFGN